MFENNCKSNYDIENLSIGNCKLGAYATQDIIDIFEEFGYIKEEDLDDYFKGLYFEFENKLTLEEFTRRCKRNTLRSLRYKEFINNEIKFCPKCKQLKPLSSFQNMTSSVDGKQYNCRRCRSFYSKKYIEENREELNKKKREYIKQNKDKQRLYEKRYIQKNRDKIRKKVARANLRKFLQKEEIEIPNMSTLNHIVSFKYKHNIRMWKDAYYEYRKVNN